MIKYLRIRNLATIEDLRLDFDPGFSVLTGETGAGKSIIIDSIRLVCGDKGSADLIRTGRSEASIEAIFTRSKASGRTGGRAAEGDGDLILQRQIAGEGTGRAYFDGVLTPVKKLRESAVDLADIYGQNDHIFLLRIDSHLDYLDDYAGTRPLREATAAAAQELRRLARQKAEWKAKERDRAQRLDFLAFQIAEIEKADLKPGEEEELRARRHILKNAEKIGGLVDGAIDLAYAGEAAIAGQLARLEHAVAELAAIDPAFGEWSSSLAPLAIVVRELADTLSRYRDRQDASNESLEALEERLSLLEAFKRKYGGDVKDIQAYLGSIKSESQDLARIQETLARVEEDIGRTFADYAAKARELSGRRTKAARELEARIETEIGLLGMKKARFHIKVEAVPVEAPEKVRDTGIDDVEFLISPNPGEELKPLRKIASGGELSRIMLALKAVGKEDSGAETLIFDEIDAGIGGKTAEFIAQKLRSLARTHQILCITHLPQIASFADQHFKIEKRIEKDRTFTTVQKLAFGERVEEVARLMSGSRITDAVLESARDMIRHNAGAGKTGRD